MLEPVYSKKTFPLINKTPVTKKEIIIIQQITRSIPKALGFFFIIMDKTISMIDAKIDNKTNTGNKEYVKGTEDPPEPMARPMKRVIPIPTLNNKLKIPATTPGTGITLVKFTLFII
ncbi:MAG: hypothetical protein WC297_02550 [Candidatus Paceibacterota bacterium]|jgi:hypothetical protein